MSRRIGPTTTRYYHRSGPQRDDDEEDDIAFDYAYYESYDDYRRNRAARDAQNARDSRRSVRSGGSDDEPLHDSSDDDRDAGYARRRRRSRGSGGRRSGDDSSNPRATRSRDINLHSPRAAVAAGSYVSSRSMSRGDDLTSRKPRSMPSSAIDSAVPTYITPRGRPPLPAGWTPMFSAVYARWYYVNKNTGKTQWEAPGFEAARIKEQQRELKEKQRGLAPPRSRSPGVDGDSRRSSTQSHNSRRSSGHLSITGMLLGAAGGIAAGTLVAKALKKEHSSAGSDRSIKRRGSRSDTSSVGERRRDRKRDDRDDFEEENVPGYHHSHSHGFGSHSLSHGHGGHGHGSDDGDDND
ncbi:hypothetical protein SEUCBS140593_010343 [Sporothrix eucalyptigena]|uniref:WW domain-containing protein n=1 Tax=Sporothrix eucalyptigena TaxID=1812306 RepID=A0ABP0D127_9PEZI